MTARPEEGEAGRSRLSTVPEVDTESGEGSGSDGPGRGEDDRMRSPESGSAGKPVPWFRVGPGCVLAWAVPGLGHVVLGRFRRGLLLGGLILALFAGGLALDGKVYRPVEGDPLSYLAAFGAAGVGLPFLVAHSRGFGEGDVTSAFHDYGNTFTLVAGLLNLLLVLDAYDVASGRR